MPYQDGVNGQQTCHFFGPFELQLDRNVLLRDRKPIKIGSRAFDLLTILVSRAGELVTKDELRAYIWPKLFVDHTNLKVTVSNLRRILGDTGPAPKFVATVSGRGYRFIAQIIKQPAAVEDRRPAPEPHAHQVLALADAGMAKVKILAIFTARGALESVPAKFCFIDLPAQKLQSLQPLVQWAGERRTGSNKSGDDGIPGRRAGAEMEIFNGELLWLTDAPLGVSLPHPSPSLPPSRPTIWQHGRSFARPAWARAPVNRAWRGRSVRG